jgi:hypothetical protein
LGSPIPSFGPCLARLFSLCSLLLITIWVTPENQLAKFALRGSSVLSQVFRGPQMGFSVRRGDAVQPLCISQLVQFCFPFCSLSLNYMVAFPESRWPCFLASATVGLVSTVVLFRERESAALTSGTFLQTGVTAHVSDTSPHGSSRFGPD